MKNWPSVLGIGYIIYGIIIITLISVNIYGTISLMSQSANLSSYHLPQYMPLISLGSVGIISSILVFIQSFLLIKRKRRIICMILAGIFCFGIPVGTILGVASFVILNNENVKKQFLN